MTRDEIAVKRASGLLDRLDGRILDLSERDSIIKSIVGNLNIIRKPLLEKEVVQQTVWKIHQEETLRFFAHLKLNQVIIGDRRMTVLYARHQFNSYTTGDQSKIFAWNDCLPILKKLIQRHCSINARIEVYHHSDGFIGEVKKKWGYFCPIGVVKPLPGTRLPNFVTIDDELTDATVIDGWEELSTKIVQMFASEKKKEENAEPWRKRGLYKNKDGDIKQRWQCLLCHQTTIQRDGHQCK
jgi:hypothetical protein